MFDQVVLAKKNFFIKMYYSTKLQIKVQFRMKKRESSAWCLVVGNKPMTNA